MGDSNRDVLLLEISEVIYGMSLELSNGMCACHSWALMMWHISGLTPYETSQYDLSAEQVTSKYSSVFAVRIPNGLNPQGQVW